MRIVSSLYIQYNFRNHALYVRNMRKISDFVKIVIKVHRRTGGAIT